MPNRPRANAGTGPTGGTVDYRLARDLLIAEVKAGKIGHTEVCDAHSELRRAAEHHSRPTSEPCPICSGANLVLVSYVFGPRLPAHGRCVTSAAELARLGSRSGEFSCYVVEVCPSCWWNHLSKTFVLDGRAG